MRKFINIVFLVASVCFSIQAQGNTVFVHHLNAELNHTSFNIEVENPESGYHTAYSTNDAQVRFPDIDFGKTYRLRVQAICNGNRQNPAPFTEWKSLTIPEKPKVADYCPECDCGGEIQPVPVTSNTLRDELKAGDLLTDPYDGGSRYTIKSVIAQGDGAYKGRFLFWAEVWNVKILCDYWNLTVNTDNQILSMNSKSVYNPQFLLDVDAAREYGDGLADDSTDKENDELDFTLDPNIPVKVRFIDPQKDEINPYYILILTDEDGNEHEVKVGELPVVVTDAAGNEYEVRMGEEGEVQIEEINYSKTKIGDGDINVYVAIEEVTVYQDNKGNTKKGNYDRLYENKETVILPPGEYKFKIAREYVEVKETDNQDTAAVKKIWGDLPITIKHISKLSLLDLSPDRAKYVMKTGENHEGFMTKPYSWDVDDVKYSEQKELKIPFEREGNYSMTIKTYTVPFERAKVEEPVGGFGDKKCEKDGFIQVLGVPDIELQIIILDPEPVYFTRGDNYKGEYGFDNYEKTELRTTYDTLKIKKSTKEFIEYAIPYMSINTDNQYTIHASTMVSKEYWDMLKNIEKDKKAEKPAAYTFTATSGVSVNGGQVYEIYTENLQSGRNNKIDLQIRRTRAGSYASPDSITVLDVNRNVVGKLVVYCSDVDKSEQINLIKVYLGDDRKLNNSKSAQVLLNEAIGFLNSRSYNQMFVKFAGGKSDELVIPDSIVENYLKERESIPLNYMFNEMGEIKDRARSNIEIGLIHEIFSSSEQFKNWQSKMDKTIIVIVNRNMEMVGNYRTSGYTNPNSGFENYCIILNNGSNDYTTYTHELGHLFGLLHPFYETNLNGKPVPVIMKGTSRNFMDYSPVTDMFWKWQWDTIRKNVKEKKENDDTKEK